MRGSLISANPVSVAFLLPAASGPWQALNLSTLAFDPLTPAGTPPAVALDKAHVLPLNRGPAGTLQNVLWADVPPAACVPGVLIVPVSVDAAGNPGPGPVALDVQTMDVGMRKVSINLSPA